MSLHQVLYYLFLVAAPAIGDVSARDWELITIDEDLNQHRVDRDSIQSVSGNIKSAWVRYDYEKPPAHQAKLKAIEAFENFDCDRRRRQILIIYAFLSDGKRIVEDRVLSWRDVTAGSSSELEFEFVCSINSAATP